MIVWVMSFRPLRTSDLFKLKVSPRSMMAWINVQLGTNILLEWSGWIVVWNGEATCCFWAWLADGARFAASKLLDDPEHLFKPTEPTCTGRRDSLRMVNMQKTKQDKTISSESWEVPWQRRTDWPRLRKFFSLFINKFTFFYTWNQSTSQSSKWSEFLRSEVSSVHVFRE